MALDILNGENEYATDSNAIDSSSTSVYDDIIDTESDFDSYDIESESNAIDSMEISAMDLYGTATPQSIISYNPLSLTEEISTDYVNAIRIDCIIDNSDYTVLFPPEHIDSIFIDGNNRLWNLSTSTISGRIVEESFNPYQTTGKLLYLTPCLGNNFNTINSYGSPNYIREYYWSSSRLYYDDTYTEVLVTDYQHPFYVSDTFNYLIVFLLFVGVILAWLNNFKRY